MDYYIKEFLKTNKLETGVPFKVKELRRLVVVDEDGSFKYVDSDEVLVLGDVFSLLSGAYHVELDNAKYLSGDTYYFVSDAYNVKKATWGDNIYDYALLSMGNVFTTRFDADNHKEEILNRCREINTKDIHTVVANKSVTNNGITYNIKDKLKPLSDKVENKVENMGDNMGDNTGDTATILNKKYKDKVSGMAMSIDKDSIDSGKYKGYTLHNGVKKDFDINATSLGEAIREALKKSFN